MSTERVAIREVAPSRRKQNSVHMKNLQSRRGVMFRLHWGFTGASSRGCKSMGSSCSPATIVNTAPRSSYSERTQLGPSRRPRSLRVSEDRCFPPCEGWERALPFRDRHGLRVICGRAACVNRCSRLWPALVVEKPSRLRGRVIAAWRGGVQRYPLEVATRPKEPIKVCRKKGTKRPHRSSRASSR
ncbi:hypothetical protein OH76DRAFT_245365 [Lentinus brumalis]|uniref:Uncharacterized protein n=1 Tax=Lentinus brumalis TaxID=2498619 RepID=A0A371CLT6_9APHY|nr:hypothetical protein OH76DRAFT_245365 [Polyporus brumalis]